jgi:zinc transport system substrate-binding protein
MNWKQASLVGVTFLLFTSVIAMGLQVEPGGDDYRPSVVVSTYPLGYLVREIGGDLVSVTVLMPPNQELHAFHPTTRDWLEASRAEVLVYNGAGADPWFESELLPDLDTGGKVVVDTTRGLDLLEARGGHDDGDGGPGHGAVDPHTWLSPWMALQQGEAIYRALRDLYGTHDIEDDWSDLKQRLEALDGEYMTMLANATLDEVIVSHEAYGYLADRYGFSQHGVIGISAEEQPSVAAISDLVDLMEDRGITSVFVDPVYSEDYASTIKEELEGRTGHRVRVLSLYFCLGPVDDLDYIEQMRANLQALAIAMEVP